MRVKSAMNRFIEAIVNRGPVRRWDVTVQFLRFYVPLYHRLTLGARRLQEVLADRLAVERYGTSALVEGLHHVVRRDIEIQHLTSKAVTDAMRGDARRQRHFTPLRSRLRATIDSTSRPRRATCCNAQRPSSIPTPE